jgi:uroporphyrin-III C-methyltransferase/precorrin-2 dehydrogenase/sirohydrochlorin ferrochelatase
LRYFPIFVDLEGRDVLIVGGGEKALQKLRLLA